MRKLFTFLGSFAIAGQLAAGVVAYVDFEGSAGETPEKLSSIDKTSYIRFPENSSTKSRAKLSADVPEALKSSSKTSAEIAGSFAWLKGAPYQLSKDFSLNFWFKLDADPAKKVSLGCFGRSLRIGYNAASKRFFLEDFAAKSQAVSDETPLASGAWHMLTVTVAGNETTFYFDGKAIGKAAVETPFTDATDIFIGIDRPHGTIPVNGKIDDFVLCDHVLDGNAVEKLYAGESPATWLGAKKKVTDAKKLKRIISKPFDASFKAYTPVRKLDLVSGGKAEAVIVRPDAGAFAAFAPEVAQALGKLYSTEFPVLDFADALKSGKTLILFGAARGNLPLLRLSYSWQLPRGAEAGYWVYPQCFEYPKGAVALLGTTPEELLSTIEAFGKAFPQGGNIPFAAVPAKPQTIHGDEYIGQKVAEIKAHYANPPDYIPNQSAVRLFREPGTCFGRTGAPVYARAFAEMQKVLIDNYDAATNLRNTPPTFLFQEFIYMLNLIEQSEAFSAEDRARSAELLRKVAEHSMGYWEMRPPMQNYDSGVLEYNENHPMFASRTVYFAAEYLKRHYHYAPADYWLAVSEYAFAGNAPHCFGPEDSAGYQYACFDIFANFAIASGKYPISHFRSKEFQDYAAYAKAQFSHLGATTGYGDNSPLNNLGAMKILVLSRDLFDDAEADSLLSLAAEKVYKRTERGYAAGIGGVPGRNKEFSADLVGLKVFPLGDFVRKLKGFANYSRPVLDKAFFRTGWTPEDEFLAVSGVSAGSHGHFDVNGIVQLLRGEHIWLTEGDYIKKQPEEHNALSISFNGATQRPPDPRAWSATTGEDRTGNLAQILGSAETPDKKLMAISLVAEKYGKVDWQRDVAMEKQGGLWVIDEVKAREGGKVAADCRFRLLGEIANADGKSVSFTQKKSGETDKFADFAITEGTGAAKLLYTQFDSGHGEREGYYKDYPLAAPLTRIHLARREAELKAGESFRFVHFLGSTPVEVQEIAPNAYRAGSDRLAVFGKFKQGAVEIDADRLFAGPSGVIAFGAKKIRLGDISFDAAKPETVAIDRSAASAIAKLTGKVKLPAVPKSPELPELKAQVISFDVAPTAVAFNAEGVSGVGFENGLFRSGDRQAETEGQVTAVTALKHNGNSYWAVGSIRPDGKGVLTLFDAQLQKRWSREFGIYHGRNGTIRDLAGANFGGGKDSAILVANENCHFYAYDLAGRELWRNQIVIAATKVRAVDFDGDGVDEVAPGIEYYYHQLFDKTGKSVMERRSEPWSLFIAVADLGKDGKAEAVFARGDNQLHVMTTLDKSEKGLYPPLTLGAMITGLVELPGGLAAADAAGTIYLIDSEFKIARIVRLPGMIRALVSGGGKLYAAVSDGWIYEISPDGKLLSKCRAPYDQSARWELPAAGWSGGAAFINGKTLIEIGKTK